MKKETLLLVIFLCAEILYAKEPTVKFNLNDGSYQAYNINDIDSMNLIKSNSFYVMKIFYDETQIAYYPTEVISKIQFDKDSLNKRLLNVYVYGYPKSYKLSEVDSIYFYIDKYQPLTIGTQVWMLKNLDVDYYRNENPIPEVRGDTQWCRLYTGAWCYYNNDSALGTIFGKLYNGYAIYDQRKLSPSGWHIPSVDEWRLLSGFLGGATFSGSKLKETGITHWQNPNEGATNECGFTALPCGFRYESNGSFQSLGSTGFWWTSTKYNSSNNWYIWIYSNKIYLYIRTNSYLERGFSVRCIKD
ncbi:MAG: hypothetical protein HW421_156 [Ignavibacteria bacterium]|nr:hypothetical protein [Ignavibacteria bacterium]